MELLSGGDWAAFENLIKNAHDTFNTKIITWIRYPSQLNRYGEDPVSTPTITPLKVLINYNYMRTWPITFTTESGELDRQSLQLLINKDYLRDLGYLNADGYFDYDEANDRFGIDGMVHKAFGDTPISQSKTDDLLFSIVVKREETPTGSPQR